MWAWRLKRLGALVLILAIGLVAWVFLRPAADEVTGGSGEPGFSVSGGGGTVVSGGGGELDAPDPEVGVPENSPPETGGPQPSGPPPGFQLLDRTAGGGYETFCHPPGTEFSLEVRVANSQQVEIDRSPDATALIAQASPAAPARFTFTSPTTGSYEISLVNGGEVIGDVTAAGSPPCP